MKRGDLKCPDSNTAWAKTMSGNLMFFWFICSYNNTWVNDTDSVSFLVVNDISTNNKANKIVFNFILSFLQFMSPEYSSLVTLTSGF
jgi:hypothetical protein